MSCGIYQILNTKNGKRYIGCAINWMKRKREHLFLLRHNSHTNSHLQNAYNNYGENFFKFEIIEHVEHSKNLIKREQFWIDKYDFDKLYNIRKIAYSNLGIKWSNKSREKLSKSQQGKKLSQEHKNKIKKGMKNKRSVIQIDIDTEKQICIFESIREASRKIKTNSSHISSVCKGKRKTAGGYKWKYLD